MEKLNFTGSGSEYFKIWIVNILLTIITLGLYTPWAKVRNRRYFYANSMLADRNFEYHATGKQLFVGFLIAMVFFIIYVVLGKWYPLGNLALFALLFVAIPWLVWRSLMFNMKVTSFSNVHFAFKGTLGKAYINFFVFPFLLILALYGVPILAAVAIPRMMHGDIPAGISILIPIFMIVAFALAFYLLALIKKRNTEYVINGSRYGQGEFLASLKAKSFMMINLKTLGVSLLFMLATVGLLGLLGGLETLSVLGDPEKMENGKLPIEALKGIAMIYAVMIFAMIPILSYSLTRQRTYVFDNIMLDNKISFKSTLRARDMMWVIFTNILMVLLTIGFAAPWAKVRMARLVLENTQVETEQGFDEYLTQKQNEESSLGDQIGDAFDVDVGVAF